MEFFKVLDERRSVRAFKQKEIEKEKIEKLLKCVNSAPSAGNLQAYKVFLAEKNRVKEKLAAAAMSQAFVGNAPLVLVFCAVAKESSKRYGERGSLYSVQDATIAAGYAQLAATALGLSSVWVGAFSEENVREALGLGEEFRPVAILPIGYPEEKPGKPPRKSLESLVEGLNSPRNSCAKKRAKI